MGTVTKVMGSNELECSAMEQVRKSKAAQEGGAMMSAKKYKGQAIFREGIAKVAKRPTSSKPSKTAPPTKGSGKGK